MCGISCVRTYDKNDPINREELFSLLCSLEARGNHATGIALLNVTEGGDASIHVHKAAQPAWTFTRDQETEDFIEEHLGADTSIALLHTRFATVGNPVVNANNHPITDEKVAIVHNGGISNQLHIFSQEKEERVCETDSDVIRMLISKYDITEAGILALNRLSGSAAIAAISVDQPDTLLIARSGSPLSYGFSETKMWFASEMGAIQKAVRPWKQFKEKKNGLFGRKSRADVAYYGMLDNTAYILGPDGGIDLRREFKTCTHYNTPTYSGMHQNYATKMNGWKRDAPRDQKALPATIPAVVEAVAVKTGKFKIAPCPRCGGALRHDATKLWKGFLCTQKDSTGKRCNASLAPLDALKDAEMTWTDKDE
jgi:asparagine synthetase B (glutamine-hydrolysing)